jgi:hypothetical protein
MQQQTGVGFMHPDLCDLLTDIETTEDVIEGDVADEDYVPRFSGMTDIAYQKFVKRAAFYNLTERALAAVVGALVRKPYALTGPGVNFDDAFSLEDALIETYKGMLVTGRVGMLLDPTPENPRRVVQYESDDIINWSDTFLVLDAGRLVSNPSDPFVQVEEDRRLVLTLVDGVYSAQYWTKGDGPAARYEPSSDLITPLFRGRTLDFIPFISLNPTGISLDPVKPPFATLAKLNVQHFNTSLLIAHGSRFFALPKPYVSGTLAGTNPDGSAPSSVSVGTEDVLLLNSGATVGYLEFGGANGMQFLAAERDKLEVQMVTLGSRLLTEKTGVESVEAINLRLSTETASLMAVIKTVEAGLNTIFEWCQLYLDGQASNIDLNKDLALASAGTSADMPALFTLLQRGAITNEDVVNEAKRRGMLTGSVVALNAPAPVDTTTVVKRVGV